MKPAAIILSSALALLGCAGQAKEADAEAPTPHASAATTGPGPGQGPHHGKMGKGDMGAMCPMNVEGTTVRVEDVEGGASLVFTTTGDVEQLRARVHAHGEKMAAGTCPMMGKTSAAR